MKKRVFIVSMLLISSLLSGCAAVVVGAGVGAVSAAHDRRSLGAQVDDKTIKGRIALNLTENQAVPEEARISIEVFNGTVLLVGQAPDEATKKRVQDIARGVANIKKIHNQIRVAESITAGTVANDFVIATKVRSSLLADERIDGLHVSVTVEDSEVFLMGLVNGTEADAAVDITRNVNGVARVVNAFEFM